MQATNSIGEQMKVIHTVSPETHEYLMDIIQDAQALGSIVHVITIIPSVLAVTDNGKGPARMRPENNPVKASLNTAPQCSPDYDPESTDEAKRPYCNPDFEAGKSADADKSPSPTCSPDFDADAKRPLCAPDYEPKES